MCGILGLLNAGTISKPLLQNFQKGKKRGPENSIINSYLKSVIMGFHRLAINGLEEKDLFPMTLDAPLNLKSKTGAVLIFAPIDFNKYEVLSIKSL